MNENIKKKEKKRNENHKTKNLTRFGVRRVHEGSGEFVKTTASSWTTGEERRRVVKTTASSWTTTLEERKREFMNDDAWRLVRKTASSWRRKAPMDEGGLEERES